jgi:hypothetical protein
MPSGKKSGRLTQGLAAAGNSRAYRPDRRIHGRGGFGVIHALQSDEQNYRPLLLRQFGETAFQVAKLEPRGLIGRGHQARIRFLQFDALATPRVAARVAYVLTIQNRE